MSFLTTALLCIMCFILSFRVTNQQRSLTDIMCMGKRYRRHNKIMAAGALEVIKTDSGHLALKVDTQGSKDFVAIRLSRKEAKQFKAVLAACDGEPLNVSVCQYKVGGKKYFILYDKNADKKVPIELNGPKEETVKSNCKTVRSAAFAIFIFSPLLHTISPANSYTITNTHAPAVVTVSVVKIWDDENNQDGIRPSLIQVTLTGSDGSTHNAAITKNEGWTYEKTVNKETWTAVFSDLPKNSKGEQIIYTLTQEGIKGYSTTITNNQTDTITVINKHEPVKTITVTVTWNDENNKDSIRPDKVTVKLTDGTTVVSTKEVKNDSWKHIFEDIPVFNGSDKVSYTITQDAVNGYTTEIKASDDGNTIEIINTHIPVVPPKEEPKKEEPATTAPVVEVKVEQPAPTVTLIQTTNKPTGISFFESLFAK